MTAAVLRQAVKGARCIILPSTLTEIIDARILFINWEDNKPSVGVTVELAVVFGNSHEIIQRYQSRQFVRKQSEDVNSYPNKKPLE